MLIFTVLVFTFRLILGLYFIFWRRNIEVNGKVQDTLWIILYMNDCDTV